MEFELCCSKACRMTVCNGTIDLSDGVGSTLPVMLRRLLVQSCIGVGVTDA